MSRNATLCNYTCPVEAALDVVGGKWKAVIVYFLSVSETLRFSDLRRKLPGVSERILTRQLRELESHGIVRRQVFPEAPPRVEYSLTEYGRTLQVVISALCTWGTEHVKRLSESVAAESGLHMKNGSGNLA